MDVRRCARRQMGRTIATDPPFHQESDPMSTFVPAVILIILGASLAVLGLLAAGSLPLIVIGLASVFGAGLLTLASEKRS
jgi:hypothetical protein